MKEATGELNMTVIVAIAVGILMAFFFTVIWPMLDANFKHNTNCKAALCDCANARSNNYKCTCWLEGNESNTFECPFGG